MVTVEYLRNKTYEINGCWIWNGSLVRGYGSARIDGKTRRVHRVMYEIVNGPIPKGKVIMHTCDNPSCINPDHLRCGTQLENIRDCILKGRKSPHPPPLRAKLSKDQVMEIKNSDTPNQELANLYGVHRKTIEDIRKGKTWRNL